MRVLSIDVETHCKIDLRKAGLYRYAEEVELLLFAYSWDDQPVQIVDVAQGEIIPTEVIDHILHGGECWAHNAAFERVCLSSSLFEMPVGTYLKPDNWNCTAVLASVAGLPASLDQASKALGLTDLKDKGGMSLIRYFSIPVKATKTNNMRTRNYPKHDPAKWILFSDYCKQDVVVEKAIHSALKHIEITPEERRAYVLDQYVNDRGILIDLKLVNQALTIDGKIRDDLTAEALKITGLDNVGSIVQLKAWLETESGEDIEALNKATVADLLPAAEGDFKRMLEIRQALGKTSTSKYAAMARSVCSDSRVRGTLKFYGAGRTGRWAGQLLQVQNLPSNKLKDIALARRLVLEGDTDTIDVLFGNVPSVLSELIRTAIVAPTGKTLTVVDFSAIEARVLAWLAGEEWRLEVFRTHGKIYEASASAMFNVPIDQITKPLRQKGKVSELALGYAGGVGALEAMGALNMGLTVEELKPLVTAWRAANPMIVKLWKDLDSAFKKAITRPRSIHHAGKCTFMVDGDWAYILLPSGRKLSYYKPRLVDGKYGKAVAYEGLDGVRKVFGQIDTHGGKIAENLCQAISRDLLRDAMFAFEDEALNVVMHVHDEAVIEGDDALEQAEELMGQSNPWAVGLPLRGDGYTTNYYLKDN